MSTEKLSASSPSLLLTIGFIALSIFMLAQWAFVLKSKRVFTLGALGMLLTAAITFIPALKDFSDGIPLIMPALLAIFIATIALAFSSLSIPLTQLSVTYLVGFQAFRVVVELLIHKAVQEGVAPAQMSWDGMNFDIVAGLSAALLFPFAHRLPKWLLLSWNCICLALLLWVVGVGVLSVPSPIQQIKPDNTWLADFPFIWLPTVLVTSALIGHLALFRKLLPKK